MELEMIVILNFNLKETEIFKSNLKKLSFFFTVTYVLRT